MNLPLENSNIPPKPNLFDQVVNYVTKGEQIGGKPVESDASALAKQAAMSLFIAAPIKEKDGKNLSVGEKILNGVFLVGVCTVLSPALAGYAIKMSSLKKAAQAKKDSLEKREKQLESQLQGKYQFLALNIANIAKSEALIKHYESLKEPTSDERSQWDEQKNALVTLRYLVKSEQSEIYKFTQEDEANTNPDSLKIIGNKLGTDPAERALKYFQMENNALNTHLKKADEDFQNKKPEGLDSTAWQQVHENVTKRLKERRENAAGDVLKVLDSNIEILEKEIQKTRQILLKSKRQEEPKHSLGNLNYWQDKCISAKSEVLQIRKINIENEREIARSKYAPTIIELKKIEKQILIDKQDDVDVTDLERKQGELLQLKAELENQDKVFEARLAENDKAMDELMILKLEKQILECTNKMGENPLSEENSILEKQFLSLSDQYNAIHKKYATVDDQPAQDFNSTNENEI